MELPLLDKWQLFLISCNYFYGIAATLVESQLYRIISTLIKCSPNEAGRSRKVAELTTRKRVGELVEVKYSACKALQGRLTSCEMSEGLSATCTNEIGRAHV